MHSLNYQQNWQNNHDYSLVTGSRDRLILIDNAITEENIHFIWIALVRLLKTQLLGTKQKTSGDIWRLTQAIQLHAETATRDSARQSDRPSDMTITNDFGFCDEFFASFSGRNRFQVDTATGVAVHIVPCRAPISAECISRQAPAPSLWSSIWKWKSSKRWHDVSSWWTIYTACGPAVSIRLYWK